MTTHGPIHQMVEKQAKKYDMDSRTFELAGDFTLASRVLGLSNCLELLLPKIQELESKHSEGWISVEDKLPIDCESVINLCYTVNGKPFVDSGNYSPDDGAWFTGFGPDQYTYKNVTHWQPLPLPPTK